MLPPLHGCQRNWIFAMLALENTVLLTSKNDFPKRMIVSYFRFSYLECVSSSEVLLCL